MNLRILLPARVLFSKEVTKIVAEGKNGSFGLLPGHIDFVSALVPGILTCVEKKGDEIHVAVDAGILVKKGDTVYVSTRRAVKGDDLEALSRTIEEEFSELDEREKKVRSASYRIEAGFVRKFVDFTKND